jgi:hypothetical protein
MDLIDPPLDALPRIDIPLLDVIPYSGYDIGKFVSFPCKAGFDLERISDETEPVLDLATFVHSWLFFGFLAEMFQRPVNLDDYTVPSDETVAGKTLFTAPLQELTRLSRRHWSDEDQRRAMLLSKAADALKVFENGPHCRSMLSPITEISLSIRIMLEVLATQSRLSYRTHDFDSPHPLLSYQLRSRGWCPSHIERIVNRETDSFGYYLSRLRLPTRPVSHDLCPDTHCMASNTTLSTHYQSAHTEHCSGDCGFIGVDKAKIM